MMNIKSFRFWATLACLMFLVFLAALPAFADNGHGHDHGGADVDVNSSIAGGDVSLAGGDVSTSVAHDSKAYAFSHGMGDVDINQCMGSEQWSTILVSKQKLVVNLWCMAESYDARGLYQMAAFMRCDIDMVRSHFETDQECWQANTISPQPVAQPTSVSDDDEEVHVSLERSYMAMQSQLSELQAIVERQQRPVVRREVIEKGGLTEKQRAALMEVVK